MVPVASTVALTKFPYFPSRSCSFLSWLRHEVGRNILWAVELDSVNSQRMVHLARMKWIDAAALSVTCQQRMYEPGGAVTLKSAR